MGIAALVGVVYAIWNIEQGKKALGEFFGGKEQQKLEVTHRESFVIHTDGGSLEVARIKAYETFRLTSDKQRWGIDLGTTESEVQVAALFRYHIPMQKQWPFECGTTTCLVRAPAPQPSPPAAIYSSETRKQTRSGWARFDKHQNLEALERTLTGELDKRAASLRNLEASKQEGKKAVEQFVRQWLAKNRRSADGNQLRVVVLFPGESATEQTAID